MISWLATNLSKPDGGLVAWFGWHICKVRWILVDGEVEPAIEAVLELGKIAMYVPVEAYCVLLCEPAEVGC